jgi:hypothetical protein
MQQDHTKLGSLAPSNTDHGCFRLSPNHEERNDEAVQTQHLGEDEDKELRFDEHPYVTFR